MNATLEPHTQIVVHRTVEHYGADACAQAAAQAGIALHNHVQFFGASKPDELARRAAEMELACELLRSITGSALVDLHKVEALAVMQQRLRG